MNSFKNKIYIVQAPDDVDRLIETTENTDPKKSIIVSTCPYACFRLDKAGIKYNTTEKYYSQEELVRLGLENCRTVESICCEIDVCLQDLYEIIYRHNLKIGSANYYGLKKLFDGFTIRLNILKNIILLEDAGEIITFETISQKNNYSSPLESLFDDKENIYSIILENFDSVLGVKHKKLTITDNSQTDNPGKNKVFSFLKPENALFSQLYVFLSCFKNRGVKKTLPLLFRIPYNHLRKSRKIISIRFTYNWTEILPELYSAGYRMYFFENLKEIPEISKLKNTHIKEIFSRYCVYDQINFSDPLSEIIMPVFENSVNSSLKLAEELSLYLKGLNPYALIFATKPSFFHHFIAQIAKFNNIPVISWQHGSSCFNYNPVLFQNEAVDSDIHLCFGESVCDNYKNEIHRLSLKTRVLPAGSFVIQSIYNNSAFKSIDKPKYELLYMTTNYRGNQSYIGEPTYYSDTDLYSTQKRILDFLGSTQREVVFKLHPGVKYNAFHLREYISDNNYRNINIIRDEETTTDLVQNSDIVITDYPSTTLLEAIATGKVVFVLLKHSKLDSEALHLLKKRAFCAENTEIFISLIDDYLSKRPVNQNPDVENTEFLEKYGIHKTDRKVAERAIEILNSEIKN